MPQGQSVTLNARHDAANQRVVMTADFAVNPVPFVGDQLKLESLEMQIAVNNGNTLDSSANEPVTATGALAWEHELIGHLQIPNQRIPFELSYLYTGNGTSGFQLELAASPSNPLDVPRVFAQLESGRLRVDVLPEEQALVLSLNGDARLAANGGMITQAQQFLGQIFGTDTVANLTDPPPFSFKQKFQLADTGLPGLALEFPTFSIFPDWDNGNTPDADPVEGVDVSFGAPRFSFQLPDLSSSLPALDLSLRNSSLRFPDLPGFEAFDLSGHLNFESGAGNDWLFRFEPTIGGALPLPDILQFFLAQFKWLQGALPELEDLGDLLHLSQSELDWFRQFETLLEGLDPTSLPSSFIDNFPDLFRAILDAAALLPDAPDVSRLFRLAFLALEDAGDDLFGLMWQVWFERLPAGWEQLVALLQATLGDLDPTRLTVLLQKLFDTGGLDLGAFLGAMLEAGAAQLETQFDSFARLWVQTLAAAVRALDPDVLATTLFDLLKNASGALASFQPLSLLPPFRFDAINAPIHSMRLDVMLLATGLQGLLAGIPNLDELLSFNDTQKLFEHISAPIRDFFALIVWPGFPPLDATAALALFMAFFNNAEGDQESEFLLIQIGRNVPLGVIFALVGVLINAGRLAYDTTRDPSIWNHLLLQSIEEDDALNVKRLDPPGNGTKYLIFSDVHRDAGSDDRGRITFGSIDHFTVHKQMYLDLLEWADNDGYTVIEAGDGEELWFIRDFESFNGPAAMLSEIIATHQPIYDKLADMHSRSRYYRIIGNHDSYLRDQPVFDVLAAQFPDGEPFQFYDHLIIPDVLTMNDGLLDFVFDYFGTEPDERRDQFIERFQQQTLGRIGLDSDVYINKKPLIVTHGHQWDFWNCDRNNLVGKLFANSVGVPVDMLLDPFIDIGGIHGSGNISVNFADVLAGLPVANNFTAYAPSRKFAHEIQQQSDAQRLLIDDIFYFETLTALAAWLTMPLNVVVDSDNTRTWSQFLANPSLEDLPGHLFNQIVIGHTHYPQARPFIDIEGLLLGPLADVVQALRSALAEVSFGFEPTINFIQPPYYNSGTAGWKEGVIWALEVDEHGVARLVYWTQDTRVDRPQYMDWQVPRMDDDMRVTLDQRKQEVLDYVAQTFELFGDAMRETLQNASNIASIPIGVLAAFSDELSSSATSLQVTELGVGQALSTDLLSHAKTQSQQIGQWLLQFFLGLLRKQADNTAPSYEMDLTLELPDEIVEAIGQIEPIVSVLPLPGVSENDRERIATALACLWLLGNRSASTLSRAGNLDFKNLIDTRYPVVWLVFSLMALLPLVDNPALPFKVDVALNGATLTLTITVR